MEILHWLLIGVACFFAVTWTIGQMKPGAVWVITVTVILWWIGIGLAIVGLVSALNLIWIMPIALLVPPKAFSSLKESVDPFPSPVAVFVLSAAPIAIIFGLAYFLGIRLEEISN
jgi:hypothetical protein